MYVYWEPFIFICRCDTIMGEVIIIFIILVAQTFLTDDVLCMIVSDLGLA